MIDTCGPMFRLRDREVFQFLLPRLEGGATARVPVSEIANKLGVAPRTVRSSIRRLQSAGVLMVESVFGRDGTQLPNRYRFGDHVIRVIEAGSR